MAQKNVTELFFNDDSLPKYSEIKYKLESSNLQQAGGNENGNGNNGEYFNDYFNKPSEERYIKSNLIVNEELSTRSKNFKLINKQKKVV